MKLPPRFTQGVDMAGMNTPWHGMPADHKLIVDFFAGGGGASKGIEMALGRAPDIAVNHDAEAIAMHRVNHPDTMHLQNDVWSVMPALVQLIGNRRVGLFHASPDCKHFSKAKGGKPVKRKIRDLAWVVPRFCRRFRPEVVTLENVEEFAGWGPLVQKMLNGEGMFDTEGRPVMVPCKRRKGQTFAQWVAAMQRLGYRVEWRERRAFEDGAPTIRKRLFVVARCDGRPIIWPAPTHGDPSKEGVKSGHLKPWRTAAECINWSLPCPSIFDTPEDVMAKYGIRVKRPLADKTMARIAKGIKRFVIDNPKPFIVNIAGRQYAASDAKVTNGSGDEYEPRESSGDSAFIVNLTHQGGDRIEDKLDPFRTVTGAHRGEKAIVLPHITRFNSGATGSRMDVPGPTATANSFIKRPGGAAPIGLVEASVIGPFVTGVGGRMGQTEPRDALRPAQTMTSKADSVIIMPTLIQTGYGERPTIYQCEACGDEFEDPHASGVGTLSPAECPQCGEEDRIKIAHAGQQPRAPGLDKPLGTPVASGIKHAVVAPVITRAQHGGGNRAGNVPLHTPTASPKDQNAVVSAHIMTMRDAQKPHNEATKPTHTIMADGARLHLVAAFLAKHFGDTGQRPGSAMSEPVSTATCSDHNAVVAAGLINMRGTAEDQLTPRDVEAPGATTSAGGIHAAAVSAFLTKYYSSGGQLAALDAPMHTATAEDRLALCVVIIAGEPWLIVDIGMRMLTPDELKLAQGFPPDYIIDRGIFIEHGMEVERRLTSTAQVRMIGNSVSPQQERALIAANCSHLAVERMAA